MIRQLLLSLVRKIRRLYQPLGFSTAAQHGHRPG
jgi:hypothetical protein